jgi:2-polyprenyl-3-methyl-5-hydroxy-6-metoxy-1,4-benzoquinol methylase
MPAPCPLCQGTKTSLHAVASDIEYFTSATRFSYFRCETCGVLFVSPMLHDRLSEIYPSNYYSFKTGKAGAVQRIKEALDRRIFRSLLKKIPGPSLAVLDVGGGTGWLLDTVRASDPRVDFTQVVDIDDAAQDLAERSGHQYFLGPIERFESERKFDLILMLNLIEHVRRPDEILAKARSLLSPQGLLLIKTPNYAALDARIFRHRSWGGYHAPRHFVLFDRDSLERGAREQGLRIVSFSYTQGAPFWTTSVLNELRLLGLVKISRERPSVYHPLVPFLQAAFAALDFARKPFVALSQMYLVLARGDRSDDALPRTLTGE